jgi:hypothetical protein
METDHRSIGVPPENGDEDIEFAMRRSPNPTIQHTPLFWMEARRLFNVETGRLAYGFA